MRPQQEFFIAVRQVAIEVMGEGNVYDYIPPSVVDYPFIYIGEQFSEDEITKTTQVPTVNQTLHLYTDNWKKRGSANKKLFEIAQKVRELKNTKSYYLDIGQITYRCLEDHTTKKPLLHMILEIETKLF